MYLLLAASLVWALSFGLIKHVLVGVGLDADLVAAVRLLLSFLAFLPFLRPRGVPWRLLAALPAVGAVQYGVMYVAYTNAYRFLAAHEVALFTILTPLFVAMLHDAQARRFQPLHLACAVLAAAGTGVILQTGVDWAVSLKGFVLVQVSNLAFAYGQVRYRALMGLRDGRAAGAGAPLPDHAVFGLLYLGGLLAAGFWAAWRVRWAAVSVSGAQLATLLYLGLVPSALGFFLWNAGARRARPATLAAMNNAKIPLAVLCALTLFGERTNLPRLAVGGGAVAAAVALGEAVSRRRRPVNPAPPGQ